MSVARVITETFVFDKYRLIARKAATAFGLRDEFVYSATGDHTEMHF